MSSEIWRQYRLYETYGNPVDTEQIVYAFFVLELSRLSKYINADRANIFLHVSDIIKHNDEKNVSVFITSLPVASKNIYLASAGAAPIHHNFSLLFYFPQVFC